MEVKQHDAKEEERKRGDVSACYRRHGANVQDLTVHPIVKRLHSAEMRHDECEEMEVFDSIAAASLWPKTEIGPASLVFCFEVEVSGHLASYQSSQEYS